MDKKKGMTYAGTGVNYDEMDPFKRAAQKRALLTAKHLERHGFKEVAESRGESAYIIDMGLFYLAFVVEGLGTKNLVADAMYNLVGTSYHDWVSRCNFAMNINDLATVGASPVAAGMYLAVGNSGWFNDHQRSGDVIEGFARGCDIAQCAYGPGETPTLRDIIEPKTADLAGAAIGVINPKSNLLLGSNIRHGDRIILVCSSGIHANGLTLGRDIETRLPDGFLTKLPSGKTYGEALLAATIIYSPLVDACSGLLHYAVNITGHGLRKLMRAQQLFTYKIEKLPKPPEIFPFMMKHGPVNVREAYGNLNMGAGYALYVPPENSDRVLTIAKQLGHQAIDAGVIKRSRERKVWLNVGKKGITYRAKELEVR